MYLGQEISIIDACDYLLRKVYTHFNMVKVQWKLMTIVFKENESECEQ